MKRNLSAYSHIIFHYNTWIYSKQLMRTSSGCDCPQQLTCTSSGCDCPQQLIRLQDVIVFSSWYVFRMWLSSAADTSSGCDCPKQLIRLQDVIVINSWYVFRMWLSSAADTSSGYSNNYPSIQTTLMLFVNFYQFFINYYQYIKFTWYCECSGLNVKFTSSKFY